ncbi:hypothetical protein BD310DRAFT_280698 [Dichomitus squalens]|uniref:Uncharacterized protein n=1 Tax=Dichomitus squalens TaxID=114155 RepID=A0A4Q9QAN2_9APHY|nr:hypothetical protein BD310DRAFT_280698 [Dichomitus squalens]
MNEGNAHSTLSYDDDVGNHRHTTDRPTSVKESSSQPPEHSTGRYICTLPGLMVLRPPPLQTSGQPSLLAAVYKPASHDDASSPLPPLSLYLMLFGRSNHFAYQLPTYTEWTQYQCGHFPPSCPHGTICQSASFDDMDRNDLEHPSPPTEASTPPRHYPFSKVEHSARWRLRSSAWM